MMVDLFAQSPDAVIIVRSDQNSRCIYACNSAFRAMCGYTDEQLVGLDLRSLPLYGANPLWPIIDRLCASITSVNQEAHAETYFSLPRLDPLFGELYAKRMPDSDQALVMVTIRDRSEHKWIEDQAYERSIIVSMLLTKAGTVVSMRSYRGPIQYDRLELSRTNSDQFVDEQDRARVRDRLRDLQFSKETGEFKFILQLFQDRFHVHSIVKPFFNGDGSFRCYAIIVLAMDAVGAPDSETANWQINVPYGSDDPSESAYKLRLLMLEKRMSVTRLAERTKISLTTISNIRNGKIKKPHRLTAQLIADQLGVSPLDIWGPYN
ncbi:helix-turn-helix domain-containing protein [Paenibacillus rhizovicinus]|uniref:Helix-turn-helix domain-containing protein n=1 Tax=Paenibacillus rhizovicinus TaxID=2704463 RepID=A0A6C0NXR8_9BACL|nr:helix-turn-helix domain-containing protein [Paenibacillus rhizovicinus]QHW30988.1 helix-turn-helix domain-containing protein [Paenibacillus rhizovicinus]